MMFISSPTAFASQVNTDSLWQQARLLEEDFRPADTEQARIGQQLFFDPQLSGNQNIACSTCHHPDFGGSDGVSLSFGEGGEGIGPERRQHNARRRLQRNAPGLFNLGAKAVHTLFHDGRLAIDPRVDGGINSPVVDDLPPEIGSIVAAQALLPLISAAEMAGRLRDNEIAGSLARGPEYAWRIIAQRVRQSPHYARAFIRAFDDIEQATDVDIVHIAQAIDAFINLNWRSDQSAFDAYLAGDAQALSPAALRGGTLFFGAAGCVECHSGKLFSDQKFYSLGLPQFGPGRTRRFDYKARDMGRINETDRRTDAYRFRTPSLRNVADTAPYGHNGAYPTLTGIIRHHLQPQQALQSWDLAQAQLPQASEKIQASDALIALDRAEMARLTASIDIAESSLDDAQINDIVTFLHALSDPYASQSRLGIPERVGSGLPVQK